MGRLFGTDGVRGVANEAITPELALNLAGAAARVLCSQSDRTRRLTAIVGRDTRASGEFLSAALTAGLASSGMDVVDVGVLPTPGVATLVAQRGADCGVVLSASHNPMPDNGIKFFGPGGFKFPDSVEDEIEASLTRTGPRPIGAQVGRISYDSTATETYVQHLVRSVPARLDGLRVVVDCAHGAASNVAPQALRLAGAEVTVIGAEPTGLNINEGLGSTHLEPLQAAVLAHRADVGIAHDGDADRCLAVDHAGQVIDGDQMMAVLALAMVERQALAKSTVVATVMSNLGFRAAMDSAGISVVTTGVGDRYVLEEMRRGGYTLGGEQSGHVVLLEHATTGDGVLTALHLLAQVATTGRPLAELAAVMQHYPQVLINVSGVDKSRADSDPRLVSAVQSATLELGGQGRVLLRPSGTEPLVRVMVEAADSDQAHRVAADLARMVKEQLSIG